MTSLGAAVLRRSFQGLVLAVVVGVGWFPAVTAARAQGSASQRLIPMGQRLAAPGFSLRDADGRRHRLGEYHGRVLLLDFWATTCGGCKIEIPWYMHFEQKFQSGGLAALGVATDDDWKIVRPYLEKHPISYPVVIGSEALEARYRVETLPVTLLIDRKGRVAARQVGVVDRVGFSRQIETLLKE